MNCRLLIIEDTEAIIYLLREALLATFPKLDIHDCGFRNATDELERFRPDVVILDLAEGTTDVSAASPSWDFIWKRHFCPVIIHSAYDASGFQPQNHPFSRYERKTHESAAKVVAALRELGEHIEGVRALRKEIENRIADSLREISPLVWHESAQAGERREMLLRLTRRRVAASLDSATSGADEIRAIEQFIYPPLENNLLAGDIVRRKVSNPKAPETYCLILTPSCDMVVAENRFPVKDVLVARCIAVTDAEILRRHTLQPNPNLAEQLGRKLKGDGRSDMLVIPSLREVWPTMIVDLKRLELIGREKIALNEKENLAQKDFVRVASMDSPFRERVAWRYIETTGRPGLPVLDKDTLEKDIVSAATPNPPPPQN